MCRDNARYFVNIAYFFNLLTNLLIIRYNISSLIIYNKKIYVNPPMIMIINVCVTDGDKIKLIANVIANMIHPLIRYLFMLIIMLTIENTSCTI